MTDQTTAPAPDDVSASIDALRDEVAQLRDLFQRRLMDDRARASLYATVQEQVREANDLLRARALEQVVLELLLAVDRLQTEPVSEELVDSAVDEILEVFARRGVVPVEHDAGFDARFHEIVATAPASAAYPPDAVVEIARVGYRSGERLLRPSRVTVAVGPRTEDNGAGDGA